MATTYPDATAAELGALCATYLRAPESIATDATSGDPVLVFNPALTSAEQATLADLTTMARFGISASLSLAEFRAIKADLVTARQYVGLASPTAAQTAAALKSLIRVVGALLRQ
jgi:hypothetical protein